MSEQQAARRKRGPNGVAEKRRLMEWPFELDEAVKRIALAKGLGVNTWVRQVMERAVKRFDRGAGDAE